MAEEDSCHDCRLFVSEPQELERALPGLNILSSAFGSVRADTGLCQASATLIVPHGACAAFRARTGSPAGTVEIQMHR